MIIPQSGEKGKKNLEPFSGVGSRGGSLLFGPHVRPVRRHVREPFRIFRICRSLSPVISAVEPGADVPVAGRPLQALPLGNVDLLSAPEGRQTEKGRQAQAVQNVPVLLRDVRGKNGPPAGLCCAVFHSASPFCRYFVFQALGRSPGIRFREILPYKGAPAGKLHGAVPWRGKILKPFQ